MEKLQAALEKARQARGQSTTDASLGQLNRRAPVLTSVEQNWADLPAFDVSEADLNARRVVTRAAGPAAVPFDILRTKILLQLRQNGWKRLAITSPMPDCGKTTLACNLTLGLGRQNDFRSILMDFDLRSPSVNEFFGVTPPHGISQMLRGETTFQEQAMRLGDNVAISMAQKLEEDPTRVLLSDETGRVLDTIDEQYQPDLVIFDLPSMLVNDDTRAFLKNVDCALIVVWANSTKYDQFDNCEREIAEQTNVLGVVLNAQRHGSASLKD